MAGRADDDTAARDADVEATVVPTPREEPERAWSADDGDDLQLPGSWRPVCRNALGVFASCVAVAGVITVVDRHWFSDWRAGRPVAAQFVSSPPQNPPETTIPAPSYSPVPQH
jgi:hypothetical protein